MPLGTPQLYTQPLSPAAVMAGRQQQDQEEDWFTGLLDILDVAQKSGLLSNHPEIDLSAGLPTGPSDIIQGPMRGVAGRNPGVVR